MHETDAEILIGLETEKKAVICPCCGSAAVVGYGKMNWRIRDLPIRKKAVFLEIKRRRLRCRDCLVTFNEPVSQISAQHRATTRLVQNVWKMALRQPFTTLSKTFGLDEKTIRNIFNYTFNAAANQFKIPPRPPAPLALEIRLLTILRHQRVLWINLDQGTLIDMDENKTLESIHETLQRVARDGAHKISVPPDAALIQALQASTQSALVLHLPSMRNACNDLITLGRSIDHAASYLATLSQFVGAKDASEAHRWWQDLRSPPVELRTKMEPLIVAVELLGAERFDAFGQPDHAYDALTGRLGKILSTDFSKRSYDVICAIVLFDKTLQKTARTGVSENGAHLGYQKTNYGTSIPKLVARLEKLSGDSALNYPSESET
ncbi:MAG: transposase family protein [Glaciimonas sp.]|nr:transposase family protein [Glaciimonas sp.]